MLPETPTAEPNTVGTENLNPTPAEYRDLDRTMWRNWTVLVALIVLITGLLVADLVPGFRERMETAWAWTGTAAAIRLGLAISALLITVFLTRQQRESVEIRHRLRRSLELANGRVRFNMTRLLSMLEVSRSLAVEIEPEAIFNRIAETCRKTFDCDQVSVMILDRETGVLEVRAATGHVEPDAVIGSSVPMGQGIAGWVAKNRKPLLLGKSLRVRARFGLEPQDHPLSAAMVVPILVRDELAGVLNVSSREEACEYFTEDLQVLQVFAEHAGVAFRHAEQRTWMRATIDTLALENEELREQLVDAARRPAA